MSWPLKTGAQRGDGLSGEQTEHLLIGHPQTYLQKYILILFPNNFRHHFIHISLFYFFSILNVTSSIAVATL